MNGHPHEFHLGDSLPSGPRWVIRAAARNTSRAGGGAGDVAGAVRGERSSGRPRTGPRVAPRRADDPPVPPKDCSPGAVLREDPDRTETAARGPRGQRVVIVRALSSPGREALDREAGLLESLEQDGAGAFPRILWRDRDALVREDAPPAAPRAGRRRAEVGSPRTTERLAQLAARDLLEESLEALHRHGWVLGAAASAGLGIRDDGTVLIHDLAGLARGGGLRERLADRRWMDAVLGDAGRTLRRPAGEASGAAPTDSDPSDARPGTIRRVVAGAPARTPGIASSLDRVEDAPDPVEDVAAGGLDPADVEVDLDVTAYLRGARSEEAQVRPAALPRRGSAGMRRGRSRRGAGHRGTPRLVPRSRSARLGYAVGVGAVFLGTVGVVVAVAGGPSAPVDAGGSTHAPSVLEHPSAGAGAVARPEAPAALVDDLAVRRRAHLLDGAPDTTTVPGSPARDQDAQLARSYAGLEVQGWRTEVRAAEVTAFDAVAGSATVRATIAESERTVIHHDGRPEIIAATDPHTVELDLVWTEGSWLVERIRTV